MIASPVRVSTEKQATAAIRLSMPRADIQKFMEPAMKRHYSGPKSGVGAKYAWEGDGNVGSGSREVIAVMPQEVRIKLDFLLPFEAHNTAILTFCPQSNGTEVSWAMAGPVPYFAKIIPLFFNMDKMVGGDFEAGLADQDRDRNPALSQMPCTTRTRTRS